MISIIITAYKEPRTIGKAIESFALQVPERCEILVTAPDKETLDAAKNIQNKYPFVKLLKDKGNGKPAALTLAISKAKGNILIFSDGDVYVSSNSLKDLLNPFNDSNIGAVSGRPISLDSKKTMYGYWAYLLTSIAHELRIMSQKKKKQFFCSGYLFAIRKKLLPSIREGLLSEDGYISNHVYKKGYHIGYAHRAEVYVKYPSTFSDWIKQKKRSAGGYIQIKKMTGVEMRSVKTESLGALSFFKFVKTPQQLWWLILLFGARLYLWALIFRDVTLRKQSQKELWLRVESTK